MIIKTLKVGENKGAPRLFLEGMACLLSGFARDVRYRATRVGEAVLVELIESGDRGVSGKGKVPVIDLNSKTLLEGFATGQTVRVAFGKGKIHISLSYREKVQQSRLSRLQKAVAAGVVTTASFCAGGGVMAQAMDDGLSRAGLQAVAAVYNEVREDLVEHALRVNKSASNSSLVLACSMQDAAFDPIIRNRIPVVDILEIGIPCSGASVAGRAKRKLAIAEDHPDVGHLVASAISLIAVMQPVVLVIENVPAYENTASAAVLRNQLAEWGYQVHESCLDSSEFGDFEKRKRFLLVAVTQGVDFGFDRVLPSASLNRTLAQLLDPPEKVAARWSEMSGLRAKELRDKEAGKGFAMQIYDGSESSIATLTKGIAKNRSTDPKIQHPSDTRLLRTPTAAEHARCKSVPIALIEGLSETIAHELLGQSVCMQTMTAVFKAIGRGIRGAVETLSETPVLRIAA
jgi:DNA (cytosine-5)-methyltransferase 1